jgi:hypothetical protein
MSWHFSRAVEAEYLGGGSWVGIPSAPWNAIPFAPADSCSDKMKGACHRSPFGTMFVPSMDATGRALLTWFQAASRARTSATPAAERESAGSTAGFGGKWRGSFARFDPGMSSWRTPRDSLLAGSEPFSGTWPKWGSMRDGVASELRILVRPTRASGSGLWPTLAAQTSAGGPKGLDGGARARVALRKLVDEETAKSMCCGRLNPIWGEWLMGWPAGWTDSACLETAKFHEWRQQHGGFCHDPR